MSEIGPALDQNSRTAATNSSFYDRFWLANGAYEQWLGNSGYGRFRVWFVREAIKRFSPHRPLNILDLGCGTGWMALFLSEYGTVTGIDFSSEAINRANEYYGQYGNFVLAEPSLPKLGIRDQEYFDVIIASEVIEHVENHIEFLKLARSLLKHKGIMILTTPNKKLQKYYFADPSSEKWRQPIENWLSPDELVRALAVTGFQIKRREGCFTSSRYWYTSSMRLVGSKRLQNIIQNLGFSHLYYTIFREFSLFQLVVAVNVD